MLVWPELFGEDIIMKPAFKSDLPKQEQASNGSGSDQSVVGLRIPYSLPLQRHGPDEVPWVTTLTHSEPDWMGRTW